MTSTRAVDVCGEEGGGWWHGRLRGTVIPKHAGGRCYSRFLAGWPRSNEATGSLSKRQRV